jgi:hypothetical protein
MILNLLGRQGRDPQIDLKAGRERPSGSRAEEFA